MLTRRVWELFGTAQRLNRALRIEPRRAYATSDDAGLLEEVWKASGGRPEFLTNMANPSSWYPLARQMRRKIIAHIGPTNSGKTHGALQAMKEANSGVYCGPLRLLAWEVHEKLTGYGVACSLITGQEIQETKGSQHISCTVEMASVIKRVEVAVLDEYQLMGDASRGWAFTRAILGLPAKELYVCGDPSGLKLLEKMCEECEDELEVRYFKRLSPLVVKANPVAAWKEIEPGDCFVAFSRREVHAIKREIEVQGQYSCCVVYGALPPESRKQQAKLFNSSESGYDILVASDAIGMGLNLEIKRIIFTNVEKFDGIERRYLTVSEVKQISGRAGRYASEHDKGFVTCMTPEDLQFVRNAMRSETPDLQRAGLTPRYEQLALYATTTPYKLLHKVLYEFKSKAKVAPHYFLSNLDDMQKIALMIKSMPLGFKEQYTFSISPCNHDDLRVAGALLAFAANLSYLKVVPVDCVELPDIRDPVHEADLRELEGVHRVLDLYLWLSYRLEGSFKDREATAALRKECAHAIEEGLKRITLKPRASRKKRSKNTDSSSKQ